MRVIAIDPGTMCGYAWSEDGKVNANLSGSWDLRARRHEGGGMRYLKFAYNLRRLLDTTDTKVVYYEEVRAHRGTDAAHVYGGIVGQLTSICEEQGVAYEGVPVGTIKKLATGKGNANKAKMIEAANVAFRDPGMERIEDDNQADALWILRYGLEQMGMIDE